MGDIVRIICPNLNCRAILSVPEQARGKVVKCKLCTTKVLIPQKKAAVASETAESEGAKKSS